jgi:hypothetical protein
VPDGHAAQVAPATPATPSDTYPASQRHALAPVASVLFEFEGQEEQVVAEVPEKVPEGPYAHTHTNTHTNTHTHTQLVQAREADALRVSICTLVLRQHFYFCTIKASKLSSTCGAVDTD